MTRNQGEGWSSNDEPAILNGSWYDENDYFSYARVIPAGWGEVSEGKVTAGDCSRVNQVKLVVSVYSENENKW